MIVRLNKSAHLSAAQEPSSAIGVEGDILSPAGKISEVEKIVGDAKRKVQEDGVPGVGVSGSNSGKGHDPKPIEVQEEAKRKSMEKVVEEEPTLVDGDAPEINIQGASETAEEIRLNLKLPEGALK